MDFAVPLQEAILIKRYKRFLADVRLPDGQLITIFCPNTGSMQGCSEPGSRLWYSTVTNTSRKYSHTWEITQLENVFVGVNTHFANTLVEDALRNQRIPEFIKFSEIRREVKYGTQNSRIDFLLSDVSQKCYLEVKNVSLGKDGIGYFPDAVTTRGTKHLQELMHMKAEGHRAVILFCVQHTGVNEVRPAEHIDPVYAATLRESARAGVEIIAYQASISPTGIQLQKSLPCNL